MAVSDRICIHLNGGIFLTVKATVNDIYEQIDTVSTNPCPFICVYRSEYCTGDEGSTTWSWREESTPTYINVNSIIAVTKNRL